MTKRTTTRKKRRQRKKERGFWLTLLLAISLIRNTLGAVAIYLLRSNPEESTSPVMITLLVILALADIVAVVAMWYWKRWGFYLLLLSSFGAGLVGLIVTGLFYMVFHAILPPAILGYIIRVQNKWDDFE